MKLKNHGCFGRIEWKSLPRVPLQEMSFVECPIPSQRESTCWRYTLVPLFDPHAVLEYLFDEIGVCIDPLQVQRYWTEAAERGCPWAQGDCGNRIPLKLFGDDCVYDDRLNKAYAIYMSLPLWRPRAARNSRFLIWAQKSTQFAGFQGLQPLLARMVWSLNMAFEKALPKTGLRFAVVEIGGDWSWNRFFWQFERHWNGQKPCPYCDVSKFGPEAYPQLKEIDWMSNLDFVSRIVGTGGTRGVNPLVLLRNFDVSLLQPCLLHNLHLGLLWTSNGAAIATFAELGFWGEPGQSLALLIEAAWDDFSIFKKQEKRHCSQSKFTIKMIFKKSHGAYFSAKGYNSRVLADWLADCAERVWQRYFGGADGRIFGKWLQERPHLLQAALADQQLAPLCFALCLNGDSCVMVDGVCVCAWSTKHRGVI